MVPPHQVQHDFVMTADLNAPSKIPAADLMLQSRLGSQDCAEILPNNCG
jgi:hypothetical protein